MLILIWAVRDIKRGVFNIINSSKGGVIDAKHTVTPVPPYTPRKVNKILVELSPAILRRFIGVNQYLDIIINIRKIMLYVSREVDLNVVLT